MLSEPVVSALICPACPNIYFIRNWFGPGITNGTFKPAGSQAMASPSQLRHRWHTWILLETFWSLPDDQHFQSKVKEEREVMKRTWSGTSEWQLCFIKPRLDSWWGILPTRESLRVRGAGWFAQEREASKTIKSQIPIPVPIVFNTNWAIHTT